MRNNALTPLRWIVGGLMVGHGIQKCTTLLGGRGIDATAAGFEYLGLRPGKRHAYTAAVTEIMAGASIASGALLPVGAAALSGTMTVAAGRAHRKNGLWANKGGYEYNVVLIAVAGALASAVQPHRRLNRLFGTEESLLRGALSVIVGALAAAAVMASSPQDKE